MPGAKWGATNGISRKSPAVWNNAKVNRIVNFEYMKRLSVEIDFSKISSHNDLVVRFSDVFKLGTGDVVDFKLDLSGKGILYPDFLTLVCSVVVYLRESGVVVKGKLFNFQRKSAKVLYASRINFFRILGFEFEEQFERQKSEGRFLEIKKFTKYDALAIHKQIIKILIASGIKDDILSILEFCLWELIDNTLNHSVEGGTLGSGTGFVSVQYYPQNKEIRLIISDSGCGIHTALTKHPDSKYKHFSESDSMFNCIKKGVTNGTGMGFGLWATAKFVELNKGHLLIHSGAKQLNANLNVEVSDASNWQGTYTFLKINTDVYVDQFLIFEKDNTGFYNELKDELFENLIDLW
jgi:hypothetical protein